MPDAPFLLSFPELLPQSRRLAVPACVSWTRA